MTVTQSGTFTSLTPHIIMPIPSHTMTHTSSLISIGVNVPPIDEMRDEFNEDFVISLWDYC